MKRGQLIKVRLYPDKEVERVVLQEYGTYILVCRHDVYQEFLKSGIFPEAVMGIPREDVVGVSELVA